MSDLDSGLTAYRAWDGTPVRKPHNPRVLLPVDLQWCYVREQCGHPTSGCVHQRPGCPNMAYAVEEYDPFNHEAYWPLRMVIPYLGRMGL